MPNWVTNVVTVTKNIKEFKKGVLNTDNEFDFNLIIPMPTDLNISRGSDSYHCLENEKIRKVIIDSYFDTDTQETFVDRVLLNIVKANIPLAKEKSMKDRELKNIINQAKGYYNIQKYNCEDWYEFCNKMWDTKWNAKNTVISESEDRLSITFETAWNTPINIWNTLAKEFDFTVVYADEDLGYNLGILEAQNKELFETSEMKFFTKNQLFVSALCIKYSEILDRSILQKELKEYNLENCINDKEFEEIKNVLTPLLPMCLI